MSFAQAATGYCEVRELPSLSGIEIPSLLILNQGELSQMESMKAAVLTAFGDAEKFEIQTVTIPTLKANQVLVCEVSTRKPNNDNYLY